MLDFHHPIPSELFGGAGSTWIDGRVVGMCLGVLASSCFLIFSGCNKQSVCCYHQGCTAHPFLVAEVLPLVSTLYESFGLQPPGFPIWHERHLARVDARFLVPYSSGVPVCRVLLKVLVNFGLLSVHLLTYPNCKAFPPLKQLGRPYKCSHLCFPDY